MAQQRHAADAGHQLAGAADARTLSGEHTMINTKPVTPPSWWLVLGTISTYSGSMVAAGHGILPVIFLLVLGRGYWLIPIFPGLLGIVLLLGGRISSSPYFWQRLGAICIFISWTIFLLVSEDRVINLVSSIPFFICLFFWVRKALHVG